MELRRTEKELEHLSVAWRDLRRKRPRCSGGGGAAGSSPSESADEALSARMPPWAELRSRVRDEDIFPPEEGDGEGDAGGDEGSGGGSTLGESVPSDGGEPSRSAASQAEEEAGGYSEFGMCLAPGANGASTKSEVEGEAAKENGSDQGRGSVWERYAAKSAGAKAKANAPEPAGAEAPRAPDADDEGKDMTVEDAPAEDVLAGLESLRDRFAALGPKIDKFLAKLNDRDPVTKKPRYGEKTMSRVKEAVRVYKALEWGVAIVSDDADANPSVITSLRLQIQQHTEQLNAREEAQQSQQQLEEERIARETLLAEQRANEQRLSEERKKREEEEELARQAEEARRHRLDEERRALEAERAADRELLASVPTLGAEGVREQIGRMREALKDDKAALDVALGSLYTLFEQIVRRPEEANFLASAFHSLHPAGRGVSKKRKEDVPCRRAEEQAAPFGRKEETGRGGGAGPSGRGGARQRRLDEERRAVEAERAANGELLASVPVVGAEGIRKQIGRMRKALKDDKAALDVGLGLLFEQIVRCPEEANFPRVWRDNPQFVEDIGPEKLDGVPCFLSREPHIETDMDGWSEWFDRLKKTLEVVEEEMLK
ncbi:hypothetical protein ACHAWF_018971 [Thalassiosira exigua]